MSASDNVVPMVPPGAPAPGGTGSGDGGLTNHRLTELEHRVRGVEGKVDGVHTTCTRIETSTAHLAKREDISRLETLIERKENHLLKWIIATVIAVTGIAFAIARWLPSTTAS